MNSKRYDIYCGIGVGKSAHHAIALTSDGRAVSPTGPSSPPHWQQSPGTSC
ncbi:hypothetical protein [Rhodococcus sp. 06-418-5]|uniref:hypothetical protein n=1 Tax=Rhodococcus sp. 06-418-5 TaxID=2022507 RepID=UPI0015C6132E|nr:hypothetical protein [Rhodococcus sp. 06-418-5]